MLAISQFLVCGGGIWVVLHSRALLPNQKVGSGIGPGAVMGVSHGHSYGRAGLDERPDSRLAE